MPRDGGKGIAPPTDDPERRVSAPPMASDLRPSTAAAIGSMATPTNRSPHRACGRPPRGGARKGQASGRRTRARGRAWGHPSPSASGRPGAAARFFVYSPSRPRTAEGSRPHRDRSDQQPRRVNASVRARPCRGRGQRKSGGGGPSHGPVSHLARPGLTPGASIRQHAPPMGDGLPSRGRRTTLNLPAREPPTPRAR